MKYQNFVGGTYLSQSPLADGERTVNWFPEIVEVPGAKNQAVLYPTPGRQSFLSTTDVGCSAIFAQSAKCWTIIGAGWYSLTANQTSTRLGTVAYNSNPAQMVSNGAVGNRIALASGGTLYYLNLTSNAISTVTGVGTNVTHVGMIDGYLVAFDPTAAKMYVSPLNDGSAAWDSTQYAQRGLASDPWKAMTIIGPSIFMIGEQTGEVWVDSGGSPFPMALYPGSGFGVGIIAPFSLADLNGHATWLTQNRAGAGQVVRAQGYQWQPSWVISDRSIENAISGYARNFKITDAEGWTYQDGGHSYYVLRFPTAQATWVFDESTNRWHERGKWNSATNAYTVWEPRCHAYAFGQHLTGDAMSGTIATMDTTFGSELDGSAIRRLRRAPSLCMEHERIYYDRFEVLLEAGLGLVSGQGRAPLVMMRTSTDGGKTWSSEQTGTAGPIGAYTARPFWTRLGFARDRMFEVSVSDPIPWRMIDAYLQITPSTAALQGVAA